MSDLITLISALKEANMDTLDIILVGVTLILAWRSPELLRLLVRKKDEE